MHGIAERMRSQASDKSRIAMRLRLNSHKIKKRQFSSVFLEYLHKSFVLMRYPKGAMRNETRGHIL